MSERGAEKGKRFAIIGVCILVLVAMLLAVTPNTNNGSKSSENGIEDYEKNHVASTLKTVQYICHPTDYKKECEESLIAEAGNTTDPKEFIKITFNVTIKKIGDKMKETNILDDVEKEPRAKMALDTCKQLMGLSIEELTRSLDGMGEYHNIGPGSDKSKRVNWAGIWNLTSKVANLLSPSKFFHGGDWIKDTGIPYLPGVPTHHRHKKTLLTWYQ